MKHAYLDSPLMKTGLSLQQVEEEYALHNQYLQETGLADKSSLYKSNDELLEQSESAREQQSAMVNMLEDAYGHVISVLTKYSPLSKEEEINMKDSATRVAKAMGDLVHSQSLMVENIKHILKDSFPTRDSSKFVPHSRPLILSTSPIRANSVCPHHFLPVQYRVFIAIKIPTSGGNSSVYGLSKYTRAAEQLAKRPVIQEQYTQDIVHLFTKSVIGSNLYLGTETVAGCMVIVDGSHGCMTCRGVESDSPTITTYAEGMTDSEIQEAWNHYNGHKNK